MSCGRKLLSATIPAEIIAKAVPFCYNAICDMYAAARSWRSCRDLAKGVVYSMKQVTSAQLREMFQKFMESKGCARIHSASVIPENDPTVLFTTAGMHPLVPYLMGAKHPTGTRLTDVQKCIRTGDIDDVGDSSHLTFFEMLGNWSLGD